MLCPLVLAGALAAPSPAEVTAALTRVGGRAEPVGYLFVLDSSQAFEPTSEGLRGDIARLVEVAPAGDSLTILAFHTRPYLALPPTTITEDARASLAAKVRTLDLPSGFDRDLGAALHATAELLVDDEAPAFTHLFGVSNFCHSPTVLSAWSSGGRGCGTIRNQASIGDMAQPALDARRVRATWFPVNVKDGPIDAGGAAAAVNELGGTIVTDAPAGWIQNFAARLVGERARPAALADAHDATFVMEQVGDPEPDGTVTLELRSTARVLDLELTRLEATGLSEPVPTSLSLAEPQRLQVRPEAPRPPWSLFPRQDSVNVPVTLTADGVLGPRPAIDLFGIKGQRPRLNAAISVPVVRRYGLPLPVTVGVLMAVFLGAGLGAVLVRGRLMPLRLGGSFAVRFRGGPRQPLLLAELSEAALVLDPEGHARVGKREEATVVLRVRRPVWALYGEVHIRANDAEINGKRVESGIHRVVPGATSIRIGEWRLTWE